MNTSETITVHCARGAQCMARNEFSRAANAYQDALECDRSCLLAMEGLAMAHWHQLLEFDLSLKQAKPPTAGQTLEEQIAGSQHLAQSDSITIDGVPVATDHMLKMLDLAPRTADELTAAFEAGSERADLCVALARTPGVSSEIRESALSRALQLDPASGWAHYCRGMDHVRAGEYRQALDCLCAAVKAEPGNGEWRSELGNVYINLGRWTDAQAHLLVAIRVAPSFASGWYNLGTAYFKDGQRAAAMKCYRRFLEIEPGSLSARQLMQMIPELQP